MSALRLLPLVLVALLAAAPARAAGGDLPGTTRDYAYDGKDVGRPHLAWHGRAYVPPEAAKAKGPVPLVVFLHGLNKALIRHRWIGGGSEGDVRRIVGDMVAAGDIAPVVIAGPGSVVASQVSHGASWNGFDLDGFVDRTIAALKGVVAIDESRIVVAGHSGAGCSTGGGLATSAKSRRSLLALLAIDTCMAPSLAERLLAAGPRTHVVVSYQTASWTSRPFAAFRRSFEAALEKAPAAEGILREIDLQRPSARPHDATVALTFQRWLPKIAPPKP